MDLVADTSYIVALLDRGDWHHDRARAMEYEDGLVTTPLIVAEADHVLSSRAGQAGSGALWDDLESGAIRVRWWADGTAETVALARRFPFAGLADSSLVALARLERTARIATFDGHFRSMTLPDGSPLTLLPQDMP